MGRQPARRSREERRPGEPIEPCAGQRVRRPVRLLVQAGPGALRDKATAAGAAFESRLGDRPWACPHISPWATRLGPHRQTGRLQRERGEMSGGEQLAGNSWMPILLLRRGQRLCEALLGRLGAARAGRWRAESITESKARLDSEPRIRAAPLGNRRRAHCSGRYLR